MAKTPKSPAGTSARPLNPDQISAIRRRAGRKSASGGDRSPRPKAVHRYGGCKRFEF